MGGKRVSVSCSRVVYLRLKGILVQFSFECLLQPRGGGGAFSTHNVSLRRSTEHLTDASLAETLPLSPPKLRPWIVTRVPPSTGPLSGENCMSSNISNVTHNFRSVTVYVATTISICVLHDASFLNRWFYFHLSFQSSCKDAIFSINSIKTVLFQRCFGSSILF